MKTFKVTWIYTGTTIVKVAMSAETLLKAYKLIRTQFCVDKGMSVEILGSHIYQIKSKVVSWIKQCFSFTKSPSISYTM